MAPISGEPAGVQLASSHQYMGARLERYLQNGAVIRIPVLHIGPLFKIRKSMSYDIYGFAINRIQKPFNMYVSVFGQGH